MKLGRVLHTPYDGDFINPEITWEKLNGRWVVSFNSDRLAYLDKDNHRLFTLNPGLREAILKRIKAETLVEGN